MSELGSEGSAAKKKYCKESRIKKTKIEYNRRERKKISTELFSHFLTIQAQETCSAD